MTKYIPVLKECPRTGLVVNIPRFIELLRGNDKELLISHDDLEQVLANTTIKTAFQGVFF